MYFLAFEHGFLSQDKRNQCKHYFERDNQFLEHN